MLPITPFPNGVSEDSHSKTKDLVEALVLEGLTVTEIARRLGVSKPTVCFHMRTLGISSDSRFSRRYDWAEIRVYYEAGHSMRECQAEFGFSGAAWSEAVQRGDIDPRPRAEAHDSVFVRRGRPLSLELHHANGDGTDNRIENLQLLCPSCHSQTDTWGGRNARRKAA